jgi:hypothetical protein
LTKSTGRTPSPAPTPGSRGSGRSGRTSTSPTGTPRAGRRAVTRARYDQPSVLERFRTPILAFVVAAVVVGVTGFVFLSSTAPTYACSQEFPDDTPPGDQLGLVQPDMGAGHVAAGEQVTYTWCPPASGRHVNRSGFGPLEPRVYGPEDRSNPQGWIHNLEHGGMVLLYACGEGGCDESSLQALREFARGFPDSAICGLPAGAVGPVIARFEEMPAPFAALVWGRVMYLDELDTEQIHEFFLRYAERLSPDGQFIAPPEPQCRPPVPSPSPGASPDASPAASPDASPAASPDESPAASPTG